MSYRKLYALIDDRLVEDTLMLRRTLGQPALKRADSLVSCAEAMGSVLRDRDGRWRMWYSRMYARDPVKDIVGCEMQLGLAESDDGLNWRFPSRGLVEEGGSTDNPFVIGPRQRDAAGRHLTGMGGVAGFCVIDNETDPHPAARGRFTAMFHASPTDTIGGILLAHSDDGIAWTSYPENPVLPGSQDTQNCFYFDRRINKYVCYQRPTIHCGMAAHANRKIARVESDDLVHWSVSRVVLDTDERDAPGLEAMDEPGMRGPRGRDKQFQGIYVFPYNDTLLAFTWFYDVRAGVFTNELLHSDDGIVWKREALREPFVADGRPEGFDGKLIVPMASAPVLVGDELYMYASASPYGHHEVAEADIDANAANRIDLLEANDIYVMSLRRDRWIGYEAGETTGELLTAPIAWDGTGHVHLNAVIQSGGSMTVTFEDALGHPITDYHLDEIPAIEGPLDDTDHLLTFGPGPKTIVKLPTAGPVRMRFFMQRATLFGFSLDGPR